MPGWNPAYHPRVPTGKHGGWFTFSKMKLEDDARKAAHLPYGNMVTIINEDGGFSTNLGGAAPKSGYMVSVTDKSEEFKVPVEKLTKRDVAEYVTKHMVAERNLINVGRGVLNRGNYVGGWLDAGKACLDVSHNFRSFAEAVKYGIANKQDAIFNVSTGKSMYYNDVTHTYEFKD